MALIPFSAEHLRVNDALPFGVRDASGKLLLAGDTVIDSEERLKQLRTSKLFVDERESEQWRRKLAGAIDAMVRENKTLDQIAQVRPEVRRASEARSESLHAQWESLCMLAHAVLSDAQQPAAGWLDRLNDLAERTRQLSARNPDAALYVLVQTAQHEPEHYSRHHALLCAVVCELVATNMGWPAEDVRALVLAALTMNISVVQLQDRLALQEGSLQAEQRAVLADHPQASVQWLRHAGVDDALWLGTVRLHHDEAEALIAFEALTPEQRLARLLRRVDIFTAKLSRRRSRVGMTPTQAARDACLGVNGKPDEVGGAILKSMGLYPPGTYVRLAGGETGVVLARGKRADHPVAAAIVNASGIPLAEPVLRDTSDPRYAVQGAQRCDAVKVRLNHERQLQLIAQRRR